MRLTITSTFIFVSTILIVVDHLTSTNQENIITRKNTVQIQNSKFEGLFLEVLEEDEEIKKMTVAFLFSDISYYGLSMFDYYDSLYEALVVDFYDCELGNEEIELIEEYPIVMTIIDTLNLDLNKDVEGFEEDRRDVVRAKFFINRNVNYKLGIDVFNMPYLEIVWNKKKQRKSLIQFYIALVYVMINFGIFYSFYIKD